MNIPLLLCQIAHCRIFVIYKFGVSLCRTIGWLLYESTASLTDKICFMHEIPYTQKFSRYEIFTGQEANRIFAIIFLQITGPLWKGSTCYVLLQI